MSSQQTQRRVALSALLEEMRHNPLSRALFADPARPMAVLDLNGTIVDLSDPGPGLVDGPVLDRGAIGRPVWATSEAMPGPHRERAWRARLAGALQAPGPVVAHADLIGPAGEPREVRTQLTALRTDTGEPIGFLLEVTDARPEPAAARSLDQHGLAWAGPAERDEHVARSDPDSAEARLRTSEGLFRRMAEALPQMVWMSDAAGSVEYFSPRWAEFTGRPLSELIGTGYRDSVHPDDLRSGFNAPPRTIDAHGAATLHFRLRRHDGEYRWMESRMQAQYGPEGELVAWFGGTVDVTERRADEDDSHALQEYLRATLELTGYGTYTWYVPEDRFSDDSQLDVILGVPMDVLKEPGKGYERFFGMVHPDDRERTEASVLGALVPGGPDYQAEFRIFSPGPDGPEEHWCSAIGRTEFDERGEPIRLIGVFADITHRRHEDDARLRLQKLEAMGTLASGVAHDFNNVIGAILSYARVAEAELAAGESPATSISEIARGALRAGDIVRRLLTFSRDEAPQRRGFSLGEVVEEACALVRPSLPAGITVRQSVGAGLPEMLGDSTQLHQVVVNLITNAGQAMAPGPGTIEVAVDEVALGERRLGVLATVPPGDFLRVRVADDGPGMTGAVLARIFDPFFTTKGPQEGTGLGLAAAQSVVRNHSGVICAESRSGSGATFTVYLPVEEGARIARPEHPPAPQPVIAASPEPARVLFVDDEEALVRLAYRAMPYCGCTVQGFTDPREALAAIEQDPQAFDALVTDLSMPGLTGLELTAGIRAVRPDLPVVMTSGYMGSEAQDDALRRGVDVIVPKPCSIDDLAAEVLTLLGR